MEFDYIKIILVACRKGNTVHNLKNWLQDWKIFISIIGKRLVSRIYEELSKICKGKTETQQENEKRVRISNSLET